MIVEELLTEMLLQERQLKGLLARTQKIIQELSKSENSSILSAVKPLSQTRPPRANDPAHPS